MSIRAFLTLAFTLTLFLCGAAQSKTTHDLSRLFYTLNWNTSTQDWDTSSRTTTTYDINGRMLTRQTDIKSTSWVPNSRHLGRYVGTHDTTETTQQTWTGSNWQHASRTLYARDSQDHTTFEAALLWMGAAWDTIFAQQYHYASDSLSRLSHVTTIAYTGLTSTWDTTERTAFIYTSPSATTPDTILYQDYDTGNWLPLYRDINVQWQNFSTLKSSAYTRQDWTGTAYENSERATCVYGPYEYRRCTTDHWELNAWKPYSRDMDLQDPMGHLTQEGYEQHDGTNWDIFYSYRYEHTYTGFDLTQTLIRVWFNATFTYELQQKIVYSDFSVSTPSPTTPLQTFTAYPLPAKDHLYLQTDLPGTLHITLRDPQGRIHYTTQSPATTLSTQGIPTAHLPSGLYLLQITHNHQTRHLTIPITH